MKGGIKMKERYIFEKEYLIAKAEPKGSVTLYTLLDMGTFNKTVAIGNPVEGIEEMAKAKVKIDITIENKRLELKDNSVKFLDVANKFISEILIIK